MTLRLRILAVFFAVIACALAFTVVLVHRSVQLEGGKRIIDALSVGQKVFSDKLSSEMSGLLRTAKIIGNDDALRQAVFDDAKSLDVSLNNFLSRLRQDNKASLMWLLELDGEVLGAAGVAPESPLFPHYSAIEDAEEQQWAATVIAPIQGKLYQLAIVGFFIPVKAPSPSFWIVIGREMGDISSLAFSSLTDLDVYITSDTHRSFWAASTPINFAEKTQARLEASPHGLVVPIEVEDEKYFSLKISLDSVDQYPVSALLVKSQKDIRQQLNALNSQLFATGFFALIGSLVVAALLSKSITTPLLNLVFVARKIGQGDYSDNIDLSGKGEVATLAKAFHSMQQGIATREKEIQHTAFHDRLTGLPNRNAFSQEIDAAIAEVSSHHGRFAICFFDFDRFKDINDTLGHHNGDRVLLAFSERLKAWCGSDKSSCNIPVKSERSLNSGSDVKPSVCETTKIARLGGDEFALLVPQSLSVGDVLDQVQALLDAPIEVECVALEIRLSIGVSFYPEHGESSNGLLQTAEIAMYLAKQDTRDIVYYEKSRDHHSMQRLTLIAELRNAIEQNQLALYFQPKLDLSCDKYRYVECLVRWIHPRFGFISPDEFIGYAEQTGAIRDLTRWVMNKAMQQCRLWQVQGYDLRVAINISALDLVQAEFSSWVMSALDKHGLSPQSIVLEVTESAVMRDIDLALSSLHALNDSGVSISIDDYGTGYSSMAQLKCLPVQELKIDKSFVLKLSEDSEDLVIVKSTIDLGHNMGLKVVAEGVENIESLDVLRSLKCDYAQGFFLSKPMSEEHTAEWIEANSIHLVRLDDVEDNTAAPDAPSK